MIQFSEERQQWLLFAVCSAFFLLLRLLYLEWDLPSLAVTALFVEDELFYTIGGFNLFHYGSVGYQHLPWVKADIVVDTNPLYVLSSFFGLTFFGNTFYAVRVPAVIAGFASFCFCFALIRALHIGGRVRLLPLAVVLIFLSLNFSSVIAGRVFEPTIFRTAAAVFCLWAGYKLTPSDRPLSPGNAFWLGLIGGISFIFVYLTNLFVPAAIICAIFLVSLSYGVKITCTRVLYSMVGFLVALLLKLLYSIVMDESASVATIIDGYINFFYTYGSRTAISPGLGGSVYVKIMRNIALTLSTNIFRFNSTLFFLFLMVIPLYCRVVAVRRAPIDIYIFSFWLLLSLQTCFINDFVVRKLSILLPFVILMLYRTYLCRIELRQWILSKGHLKIFFIFYSVIFLLQSLGQLNHSPSVRGWSRGEPVEKSVTDFILATGAIGIALAVFLLVCWYCKKDKLANMFAYILILALFVPEIFMDYRYIFGNPTFNRRDLLIKLAPELEGKQVIGCESIGMRLYNDATVYLNPFRYIPPEDEKSAMHKGEYGDIFRRLIAEGRLDYSFCRIDDWRFDMEAMGLELVVVYPVDADEYRALALYQPKKQARLD